MSIERQILVVVLCYPLAFWFIRGFLWGVKRYSFNTSAYKKRKKGQTFKEWFLYSRYREEIPKILLVLYFTVVFIHPFVLVLCVVFNFLETLNGVGDALARGIVIFDYVWYLLILLLFWSSHPGFAYKRWIPKRDEQQKKKR